MIGLQIQGGYSYEGLAHHFESTLLWAEKNSPRAANQQFGG